MVIKTIRTQLREKRRCFRVCRRRNFGQGIGMPEDNAAKTISPLSRAIRGPSFGLGLDCYSVTVSDIYQRSAVLDTVALIICIYEATLGCSLSRSLPKRDNWTRLSAGKSWITPVNRKLSLQRPFFLNLGMPTFRVVCLRLRLRIFVKKCLYADPGPEELLGGHFSSSHTSRETRFFWACWAFCVASWHPYIY